MSRASDTVSAEVDVAAVAPSDGDGVDEGDARREESRHVGEHGEPTYWDQGRWEEAEKLEVQMME